MTPFISITVILLSLLLIFNNFSNNRNSIYICGSIIIISLGFLNHYFTFISPNLFWIAINYGHIIPLHFLSGPLLFLYNRNALKNSTQLSKVDYLHFLPFIISLISIFPYYFIDFDSKLRIAQLIIENPAYVSKINLSWLYPSQLNLFLRPFFLLAYSIGCLLLSYRFIIKRKISINKQKKIFLKWLLLINSIMTLLAISYSFFTIFVYNNASLLVQERKGVSILNYILNSLFFLIPILLLTFPEILYGFEKIKKNTTSKKEHYKVGHKSLEVTAALILDFIKKEENLLNPNFSIADISEALKLKSEDIRYCFNIILKTKYTTLRKELRVDFAKNELRNGKLLSHSMEGIWTKSGFKSKTGFFVTFKEVTGMTPLEYLKSLEK